MTKKDPMDLLGASPFWVEIDFGGRRAKTRRKSAWMLAGMLLAFCLAARPVSAQSGDTDAGEIAGRVGAAFGGGSPGMGTQISTGGSSGVAFSRYGMAFIDIGFMPLGQHTIQGWPDRASVNRSYLLDFGVDFHIRVPVRHNLAPYAIAGTGLMWNMVRENATAPSGGPVVNHWNQFNGALHTGGGVRYYVNEKWGIRPEVKVIVSKQIYTSFSVGVFYVVPAGWF
jgi:hypothetical protein